MLNARQRRAIVTAIEAALTRLQVAQNIAANYELGGVVDDLKRGVADAKSALKKVAAS